MRRELVPGIHCLLWACAPPVCCTRIMFEHLLNFSAGRLVLGTVQTWSCSWPQWLGRSSTPLVAGMVRPLASDTQDAAGVALEAIEGESTESTDFKEWKIQRLPNSALPGRRVKHWLECWFACCFS